MADNGSVVSIRKTMMVRIFDVIDAPMLWVLPVLGKNRSVGLFEWRLDSNMAIQASNGLGYVVYKKKNYRKTNYTFHIGISQYILNFSFGVIQFRVGYEIAIENKWLHLVSMLTGRPDIGARWKTVGMLNRDVFTFGGGR